MSNEGPVLMEQAKAINNARLMLAHQKLRLLQQRNLHKKNNGILYYKPHAKQIAFHKAGWAKRRYVRTGNRWGKSTAGAAEDISWCRGERVFFPEGSEERTVGIPRRAVKGVILVQDWEKADEIFTNQSDGAQRGKIFKLLPTEWFEAVEKNNTGHVCKILIKSIYGGVSTIFIDTVKSFLSNAQGQESSDWDFIHVDEPIPQAMWEANARGLIDRGGYAWFLCTPQTEMWINDYFFPEGTIRSIFADGLAIATESKWLITGSTYDNENLSEEDIRMYKQDIPKAHWATRIDGKPKALAGTIYTAYDCNVHLYTGIPFGWKSHFNPPENYTIRVAIDPHPTTPHAVLFAATSPFGITYFYQEIWDHCLSALLAKQILHALNGRKPHVIICDPLALQEHPNDGRRMVDDFDLEGLVVQTADKDLARGILNVQNMLDERDMHGNPVLKFSNHLTRTLFEFDRYVYDPETGKPKLTLSDHMMENLYRLVNIGLRYVSPEKTILTGRENRLPSLSTAAARQAMHNTYRSSNNRINLLAQQAWKKRYGSEN